ncbi:hypothetical protein QAD02_007992, partial [Eretmocerus hayati]
VIETQTRMNNSSMILPRLEESLDPPRISIIGNENHELGGPCFKTEQTKEITISPTNTSRSSSVISHESTILQLCEMNTNQMFPSTRFSTRVHRSTSYSPGAKDPVLDSSSDITSRSRSPSIPRRRGSPSFLDRRRIT